MTSTKFRVLLIALLVIAATVSTAKADISNAAVLFLRIAPGARAAGMGEAFVAIADDATATHWNPAGLGSYPLSSSWIRARVPSEYQPLTAMAVLTEGRAKSYQDYDVWALTAKGLIRYDNKRWNADEVFPTKTSETVEQIASRYFNITDKDRLDEIVKRIAAANNDKSYEWIMQFRDSVMAAVPEDYSLRASLVSGLDSLPVLYEECRLNWDRVNQAADDFRDAAKDGSFSEKELDRVNIAMERSRSRFIKEELRIPYSVLFKSPPTQIASNAKTLLVGGPDGLYKSNGATWQPLTREDNLPSDNILVLREVAGNILVGTDSGLVMFNGLALEGFQATEPLPAGPVTAVGANDVNNIYAVVNNDLYHYDGQTWSNSFNYTAILDDTIDSIVDNLSIYGTAQARERYREKLEQITEAPEQPPAPDTTAVTPDTTRAAEQVKDAGVSPGRVMRVPYVAEIKGHVNDIYVVGQNQLWLGTEYGVLHFDGSKWTMPGYREYTVQEGDTWGTLMAMRADRDGSFSAAQDSVAYEQALRTINDLDGQPLTAGQTIMVYAYPNAHDVTKIEREGGRLVFATPEGLLYFNDKEWGRADIGGLSHADVTDIVRADEEVWFAGTDEVVTLGRGQFQMTGMHVKWLPDLADDLYYDFMSFVTSKQGLGTFGGNVTFISYGSITRTGETSPDVISTFESFDLAVTASFGTSLTDKLAGGFSVKFIYSRLADQGAGIEQGSGTSSGFALDLGLLYHWTPRLSLGMAVTNIGPKMKYIDAAQSDDLPRNLAFGFAYKLINKQDLRVLVTAEGNKLLVGLNDGLSQEFKEVILNGGMEVSYVNLIAARLGYIYDQEGQVKALTVGFGLNLIDLLKVDLAYIPSQNDVALANTLRVSATLTP